MLRRFFPVLGAVAFAAAAALFWRPTASVPVPSPSAPSPSDASGRTIWLQLCAVCHGPAGAGTSRGTDITASGTAAMDFQVRTGRMPIADPDEAMRRRDPVLDATQIDALVTYTDQLVTGPRAVTPALTDADLRRGGEVYLAQCAACHQAAGAGGALARGDTAPSLYEATPREVGEAIRSGPGNMPQFAPGAIDDRELADVAAYVDHLKEPGDRGGFDLGHLGPVPEGLVAVAGGLGAIVLATRWLGTTTADEAADGGPDEPSD